MSDEEDVIEQRRSMTKALKETNEGIIARLAQMGAEPTNVEGTRHEMFVGFLVDNEILTVEQADLWALYWQDQYNTILMSLEVKVQKMLREQQARQRRRPPQQQVAPKLYGPGGQPIL